MIVVILVIMFLFEVEKGVEVVLFFRNRKEKVFLDYLIVFYGRFSCKVGLRCSI